jgi:hypothetical protein
MVSYDGEIDETYGGGVRPDKRGRAAVGRMLLAVAIECKSPRGFGRCRLQVIPEATAATLKRFLG